MNIYLSIALLLCVSGASFGFGRYTAPPKYRKQTVYQNGDIYPGEFFVASDCFFMNSKIILPDNFAATHWNFYNNLFDRESGDNLIRLVTPEDARENVVVPH